MYFFRDKRRFLSITYKAFTLLAAVVIFFLTLFLIGNYQQFLDRTQHLIMDLLSLAIVLHILTGIFFILFIVLENERDRFLPRRRFAFLIISISASLLLFIILQFFRTWLTF